MDVDTNLPEVLGSESGSDSVRGVQESVSGRLELRPLVIRDVEHARELSEKYLALQIPKVHVKMFESHLVGRTDSYFTEAGDAGLIYLTTIVPRYKADLNFVFWDGKLGKDRRELVRTFLYQTFSDFALERISAYSAARNVPFNSALRKIGFVCEGTVRKGWIDSLGFQDMLFFGMLREELR